jgi:hypothetical protein
LVLPNASKKFLRGTGSGVVIGNAYGALTARPTSDFTTGNQSVTHSHQYSKISTSAGSKTLASGTSAGDLVQDTGNASVTHSHTVTGGGDAETRPENLAINIYIKY